MSEATETTETTETTAETTAPTETERTAPAPEAATETPAAAEDRAWLPEEYRSDPAFGALKDASDLAKSYKGAQSLIGKRFADMDWAQYQEVARAHGLPKEPEGYEFKVEGVPADSWDKDLEKDFRVAAHRIGILPAQAQELATLYAAHWKTVAETTGAAMQYQQATARATAESMLANEWGEAMPAKLKAATRALKSLGADAEAEFVKAGLMVKMDGTRYLTSATLGKLLADQGSMQEPELVGGNSSLTPANARASIAAKKADKDFYRRWTDQAAPGHAQAVEEMNELYRQVGESA